MKIPKYVPDWWQPKDWNEVIHILLHIIQGEEKIDKSILTKRGKIKGGKHGS